jgi:UDP-N-acetylglucosamine/UDP-N-acetylgalactosamine diphosphorylase
MTTLDSQRQKAEWEVRLAAHGQSHLLRFWDQLDHAGQARLCEQLAALDLELIDQLWRDEDAAPDFAQLAQRALPPPAVRADGSGAAWTADEARRHGCEALRAGRVGMIVVAGGQGTRLGFDQAKAMYPIGPLSQRTLLQMLLDRLVAMAKKYDATIPLYVMTSPATHDDTLAYLEANHWFGWSRNDLRLFCQGTMPAVDLQTGKLLLQAPDQLALSPDGHGGMLSALTQAGLLDDARQRGIQQLFYAQIDNPLVAAADPLLIGHHLMAGSDMTTQVVSKREPLERVGNVVLVDGRVMIIEYSDLPADVARQRMPDGSLKLWAGNIAVHVFERAFLERASLSGTALPFHRAIKVVPTIDEQGRPVQPTEPNGLKFERFIFDLLPMAENAFVVESRAEDVFAPVKNSDGAATDTPAQSKAALSNLYRRWLRAAGVEVAEHVPIEIHPNWAVEAEDVAQRAAGLRIVGPTYLHVE